MIRLLTLDPGHFHAALVQKTMLAGVDPVVHVYAPLGPDLLGHLGRIAAFNRRKDSPTSWRVEVHASDDFLERACREKPGEIVVIAGRNRDKIRCIHAALSAGLHVLADKPWVLVPSDLPLLVECLKLARARNLVVADILTERYEITAMLVRDLVLAGLLGEITAVEMFSSHGLIKSVAGVPLRRPMWFFDPAEQGLALSDVGVHLVDLVQWIARPNLAIALDEIALTETECVPLSLSSADFERITGIASEARLYPARHRIAYSLGRVAVRLDVCWERECPAGDQFEATFTGSRGVTRIRPDATVEVLVSDAAILRDFVAGWNSQATLTPVTEDWQRVTFPQALHVGHEAHFAQVAQRFLADLANPAEVPDWEDSYALARYHITTHGVAMAR